MKKHNRKGEKKGDHKKYEELPHKSDSCLKLKLKKLKLRPETRKFLKRKRFRKIKSLKDLAHLGTQAVLQILGIGPSTLCRLQKLALDHEIRWNFSEHEKAKHATEGDVDEELTDVSSLGMM